MCEKGNVSINITDCMLLTHTQDWQTRFRIWRYEEMEEIRVFLDRKPLAPKHSHVLVEMRLMWFFTTRLILFCVLSPVRLCSFLILKFFEGNEGNKSVMKEGITCTVISLGWKFVGRIIPLLLSLKQSYTTTKGKQIS